MDKHPPDYSKMSPDKIIEELKAKLSSVMVKNNQLTNIYFFSNINKNFIKE